MQMASGKFGFRRQENRVTIHLGLRSKQEMKEIRKKLEVELDLVRKLVSQIEANEGFGKGGGHGNTESRRGVSDSRPLHQLSVAELENGHGGIVNVDKEKRTPKANQLYQKSDFLLAKDKIPPGEGKKKMKSNMKKQGGGELGPKFSNQLVKACSSLLDRLMKHKYGWVFRKPVDAKGLGLHDYFDIIKHPMDLGTAKSRLDKNWYNSPREFAEDVRLTFNNAMTYNPRGQDVYVMAEQLLKIFEDRWMVIEADFMRQMMPVVDYESGLPTPTSNKAPSLLSPPPPEMRRILDRQESAITSVDPKTKHTQLPHSGRTSAPKKPKAREPNKREMTYDEKQQLSTNLQSLPSEKLDNIVQIIKKRNPSLSQHDDEIEVDIDTFDTETLWELDRFVTNYKKSINKNKRKAEGGGEEKPQAEVLVQDENPTPAQVDAPKDHEAGTQVDAPKEHEADGKNTSPLPVQVEKPHADKSGGSSSSSSGSGSSSNDSDSDSSSANGSDASHSPEK